MRDSMLALMLEAAVPLQFIELGLPGALDQRLAEIGDINQIIAEKSEALMAQSGTKGEVADAFNAIAKGIAVLSCTPGGVDLFERRWENGRCAAVLSSGR